MIFLRLMDSTINTEDQKKTDFTNRFLIIGQETGKNTSWMYLLGIFAAFCGYSLFQTILFFPLMSQALNHGLSMTELQKNLAIIFNADAIGVDRSLMLALLGGMFIFSLLFLYCILRWVHKKPFLSIVTSAQKLRWGRYFFSFSIWSVLILIYISISYFLNPQDFEIQFNFSKFMVLIGVSVIFLCIQTATEEIIFRGYILQGLSMVFKNGILPLIITSVLFGLMHSSNPESKAHGLLIMMPYYMLFGGFLGVLALLGEGLELSLGIHCANNLISSLIICSKNSAIQTDSIFYSLTEKPIHEFIAWIIMATICFFILFKKYKLNNFKLLIR